MTNAKPAIKQDLMRELRARAIPIGFWTTAIITGLIIGVLTDWKY